MSYKAFYKCMNCLGVTVVDQEFYWQDYSLVCGICKRKGHGAMYFMGVRKYEADRLSKEYLRAKCDDRCVGARGPVCSCRCGGENHGSMRYVLVIKDAGGIPTVTPIDSEEAKQRRDEFWVAQADALHAISRYVGFGAMADFIDRRWVKDRGAWGRYYHHMEAYKKAISYRSQKKRIEALEALSQKAWEAIREQEEKTRAHEAAESALLPAS